MESVLSATYARWRASPQGAVTEHREHDVGAALLAAVGAKPQSPKRKGEVP